jgi:hypothetical protein
MSRSGLVKHNVTTSTNKRHDLLHNSSTRHYIYWHLEGTKAFLALFSMACRANYFCVYSVLTLAAFSTNPVNYTSEFFTSSILKYVFQSKLC